jgi:hypothetical protein
MRGHNANSKPTKTIPEINLTNESDEELGITSQRTKRARLIEEESEEEANDKTSSIVKTTPNNNSGQITQNQEHFSQTIGNQMTEKDQ